MKHHVRNLLRLIASALIVFGAMEAGLEYTHYRVDLSQHRETHANPWRYILGAVLIAVGIFLFALSARLADRLTENFEE